MPWPLRIVDPNAASDRGWEPGDCWYAGDRMNTAIASLDLSPEYTRDWEGKRPPIIVAIPMRSAGGGIHTRPFCVDERARPTDYVRGQGNGWTVTGELPNISVSPSIHAVGAYHGWITDGVLSDGIEG